MRRFSFVRFVRSGVPAEYLGAYHRRGKHFLQARRREFMFSSLKGKSK